jgi:hypothetical protein
MNSIAYASIRTTFVGRNTKSRVLEAGKEEDEYEKMSLKAKIETTMTILNLIELRQKISISMSIYSDDTPDYKNPNEIQ